ncbi:hypothetical protein [Leuconostoc mesenteroides]|uniref:hypothetical protein n=1 Tax=Leuconostoc mesenteroides TaxID=1245 RepID=UPI0011424970|nr:hypothetical protein [Leuconostoc mesenteroides]GEA91384.1 hypothetical protein LME01_11200 [Leuconostoc mesenteroides subsp. mesenteroides]
MSKKFADLKYTIKQKQVIERLSAGSWSIMMNSGAVGSGKIKIDNNTFLKELRRDYSMLNIKFDMCGVFK